MGFYPQGNLNDWRSGDPFYGDGSNFRNYNFDITTATNPDGTPLYLFYWDEDAKARAAAAGISLTTATGKKRRYHLMRYGGVYILNDGSLFPKNINISRDLKVVYRRPIRSLAGAGLYGCLPIPVELSVTWNPYAVAEYSSTIPICGTGETWNAASNICVQGGTSTCNPTTETTTADNGGCIYKFDYT